MAVHESIESASTLVSEIGHILSDFLMNEADASHEAVALMRIGQYDSTARFPGLARICLTP